MCIEYAFKRGGISLIRNFLHQAEGVKKGLPEIVQVKLALNFKLRTFTNGRVTETRWISDPVEGFYGKGDKK